jgi:pilus assembly protein Flp/PilA
MVEFVRRLIKEEEGQGMAEYGLILALVAIAVIAALIFLGGAIGGKINQVAENLEAAGP